ncbi:unnamed protein product [Linum tenue]|uniref:VQ domain-containing protein n=1 Tax=Linum tenue TaxID=586396 RepID=A0AAV0GYX5_9ROSI|nr:unnamed protein product [Linum tenue]
MRPTTSHSFQHDAHHHNYNQEATRRSSAVNCPPPLKVNKDSRAIIKTSSSASSLAVAGSAKPPPQRHPVIIYTHSPKVIHTHPRDFMALVQKLTGLSRSDQDPAADPSPSSSQGENHNIINNSNNKIGGGGENEDNESSSVITEENCGDGQQANSSSNTFVPSSIFESPPPNPYHQLTTNVPVFPPSGSAGDRHLYCGTPNPAPFFNYTDPLFFGTPSFRNLDAINDHFRDF